MWNGRPEDAGHRSAVLRAMRAQSMEFSELNVEYGYCYQSAAVVPDGSAAPAPADDIRVYQPSTRPGAPLPHAWIDDEDGHRRPVKDLVAPGRFLLIAGEDGQAWCQAARQLAAEAGLPLDAVRIGHLDGDLLRPALRLAAPPADRQRRRDPGPPGPVHRLAAPGRRQRPPGRPCCRAQPDPRPAGGSGGQSGTASASFSATSFRSACRRASSSSCKALAMAASCSLATFTLASARSAWACAASAWALRPSPGSLPPPGPLRPSPATRAWDVCSRPSPGFGASTSAPAWPWTMRLLLSEPPSASALTLVTRAARGAARRPLQIEVHRLRLPSGRLGLSVPVSQGP